MNHTNKIIDVISVMSDNPDKIENVTSHDSEIYFTYFGTVFSIMKRTETALIQKYGSHSLYVYPQYKGKLPDSVIEDFQFGGGEEIQYIVYHSKDYENHEVKFSKLHGVVFEKIYKLDEVYDEILKKSNRI